MKAAALLVLLAAACVVTTSAGLFEPTLSSLLELLFIRTVTLMGPASPLVVHLSLIGHWHAILGLRLASSKYGSCLLIFDLMVNRDT